MKAQYRDIESSTAEVVNGDNTLFRRIETVGDSRRGGFVQQAQYGYARYHRRILGSLTLGLIEVRRYGYYRPVYITTECFNRTTRQLMQDCR